jgi:hypothetical protein
MVLRDVYISYLRLSFLVLFFPNLPRCLHPHLPPLVMIRRMTDKLGHLAHGHQKTLQQQQQQQAVPGLPLPVTTHTHLEHRGSISTQRTSESSKRGESVDEAHPIGDSNFPCQRRAKGTYRLADFLFQRTLGTGSFGRVHLGRPPFLTVFLTLTVDSPEQT